LATRNQVTLDKYGKLNILVNDTGVSLGKDIEGTTLADWNWADGH